MGAVKFIFSFILEFANVFSFFKKVFTTVTHLFYTLNSPVLTHFFPFSVSNMATGPLIVQTPEETPTTSDECNGMDYQPQDTTLMADRRHSISFRQRHRSSSSDEEEVKPRKFSMDQHRSRSLQKEARIVNGKKEDSENIVCGASMAISNEFLAPSPVAKRVSSSFILF